jgi:NAD+ synthase
MSYDDYMRNFSQNAKEVKDEIVKWIRDWFDNNGKGCTAVVGLSGGKDSSVVAALCVEALGADKVFGVFMPNSRQCAETKIAKLLESIEADYKDVELLAKHLGIKWRMVDIGDAYDDILSGIECCNYVDGSEMKTTTQTRINLSPRIRMSVLYAVAQSKNGRVANTCNLSEDWVGYSTRYGDSVGDFSPLSMLTTDEVIEIGIACGLPEELVRKTPSDGLCGKTDEDNLGFTYRALNEYIRWGTCSDDKVKEIIDDKHKKNMFKLELMPKFDYPHD